MKTTFMNVISLTLFAFAPATFASGRGGGGGHFGGGFGGGEFRPMPAFRSGGFGGVRYSFGARPNFGQPVNIRPQAALAGPTTNRFAGRQSALSVPNRATITPRLTARNATAQPTDLARNHIFARRDATAHPDWDRHSAHYWKGHWWSWDGGAWLGLNAGFYPWDYYPYYAYDYYPYDYYPGYYADVEPYYNQRGVDDSMPTPDATLKAVQTNLAKLGYYNGTIDGLYGKTTRDAVARYQSARNLSVTGTLTLRTLKSLGIS
jgi:hypothetical protein